MPWGEVLMRMSLSVNGTKQAIASLEGAGYLSAHLNMYDRPKEEDRSSRVFIRASRTEETETTSMKWQEIELSVGDVVQFELLPDGNGDPPSEVRRSSDAPSNLLASSDLAKELLEVVSKFDKSLLGLLERSRNVEGLDEHRKFSLAVGAVIAEVGQQLLYPVFRRHKELIPDDLKGELL